MLTTHNATKLYWRQWIAGSKRHYDLIIYNRDNDTEASSETTKPVRCFIRSSQKAVKYGQVALPKNWCIVW